MALRIRDGESGALLPPGAPGHVAQNYSQNCIQCHTQTAWTGVTFTHPPATAACITCHSANYQAAPNHVAQSYPQTCATCHTQSDCLRCQNEALRAQIAGIYAKVLQAVADEEELEGPIPIDLRGRVLADPAEVLRATVRATKHGIHERIERLWREAQQAQKARE